MPLDSQTQSSVDAGELEGLLALAERLKSSSRRAFFWHRALIVLSAMMILIGLSYLGNLYGSRGLSQIYRDPISTATACVLFVVPGALLYASRLLQSHAAKDRRAFHEISQTLHEFVGLTAKDGSGSVLQHVLIKVRLSRLEIGGPGGFPYR